MSPSTIEQLVCLPSLLYAFRPTPEELIVYRSPVVKDTSEPYDPVRDLLNSTPHSITASVLVEDKDMMFGSAYLTSYKLGVR